MGQDLGIRQLCGPNQLLMVGPFGELAAGVINTTELRMCGAAFADAGPTTMLYPGVIVGMVAAAEATIDTTVQCTVDGANLGAVMTVDAVKDVLEFAPGAYVPFTAGQAIGAEAIAVTTNKDLFIYLAVVLDLSGEG